MALLRTVAAILACSLHLSAGESMTCGTGVPLCGTLTLASGLGNGVYKHAKPTVHGLWPENGNYGTSKCIAPQNSANPTKVYDCYTESGSGALAFETHEWTKHGACAGVKDVDDFFGQICSLSAAPLAVMETAKFAKANFAAMAQTLKGKGYPVWNLDETNDQIELSACAGSDGQWKLSAVADMPSKCGGSTPSPGPTPPAPTPTPPAPGPNPTPPAPSPSSGKCTPGKQGPKCSSDKDCSSLDGCVRCAKSGFCTDQKLFVV